MQHLSWPLAIVFSLVVAWPGLAAAAAPAPPGSRLPWLGSNWYLSGANVPWVNWACDFGCTTKNGISASDVSAALKSKFQQAHASGLHTMRWWTFEGDPWQITRDATGA